MQLRAYLSILLLAALWGPSFFFIKIALTELPPLTISALRFSIAALFLWALIFITRQKVTVDKKLLGHLFVMSIFSMALPISMINFGEQYIDSSLAGIINGAVPILTVILAMFTLPDAKIGLPQFLGVATGALGFLFLLLPSLTAPDSSHMTLGILLVSSATCSYAIGLVYAKKHLHAYAGIALPAIQLVYASMLCLLIALVIDKPWQLAMPSASVWLAISGMAILGTALAFILYYKILASEGPVVLSMTTYLLPLFAILLGVLFLHETIQWKVGIAALCILFGMKLVNTPPKVRPT